MTWGTAGDLTMSVMESRSLEASISIMVSRNGGDMRELLILRRVVVDMTDVAGASGAQAGSSWSWGGLVSGVGTLEPLRGYTLTSKP
ncbi:hypothetical protein Sjap_002749 [Stephania japonica]|uniref:Uncharacterized protein n=1 Tax=Stephania japonica TaxID=461633 RepID=A0AAP0KP70_9MAGN